MSEMQASSPHPAGSVVPVPDLQVSPGRRRLILVLSIVLFVVGTIGSNVGPAWVDERPAIVLAMSSRNRNLLGSVPFIDVVPFALLGFGRVLLAAVALYFLGKWYGDKAVQWTEGQVGELPAIYGWFQRAIDRAGWLMLILMPGSNLVCLMAGYRRMRTQLFLTCVSLGIALKLVVIWWGGKQFEEEIVSFLEAINDYQWWIVAGLFGITFLQSAKKVRKGLPEMIDEIETPDGVIEPHEPHHGRRHPPPPDPPGPT
jgi:membrane protein DedA with SNARE-associated domain